MVFDPRRLAVHEPSAMSTKAKPELAQTYSEMHGLLVQLGKHYCPKQNPKCEVLSVAADAERWPDEIAVIMRP